jgi:hypothetical protein
MSQDDIQSFADKRSSESKAAAEQRMQDYKEGRAKSMEEFKSNMQKISEAHDAKMEKARTRAIENEDFKDKRQPKSDLIRQAELEKMKEILDKPRSGGGGGGGGIPKVGPKKPTDMKKGGMVSSASKRADGCAVKGKTKGRMI